MWASSNQNRSTGPFDLIGQKRFQGWRELQISLRQIYWMSSKVLWHHGHLREIEYSYGVFDMPPHLHVNAKLPMTLLRNRDNH